MRVKPVWQDSDCRVVDGCVKIIFIILKGRKRWKKMNWHCGDIVSYDECRYGWQKTMMMIMLMMMVVVMIMKICLIEHSCHVSLFLWIKILNFLATLMVCEHYFLLFFRLNLTFLSVEEKHKSAAIFFWTVGDWQMDEFSYILAR